MKKLIVFSLLTAIVFSCGKNDNEKYVTIAGKLENAAFDSVFVFNDNVRKGIAVKDGVFKDTMKLGNSTYFKLLADRDLTQIFLNPGDSLFVSTNMEDFDNAMKFGGTNAAENNYLAKKQLAENKLIYMDPSVFFSVDPLTFKNQLTKLKTESLGELEKSESGKVFKDLEKKNIDYHYFMMLTQYPMAHSYFTDNQMEMPADFQQEIDKISLDNEHDFVNVPSYGDFVKYRFTEKIDGLNSADEVIKILSGIKSAKIKDGLMRELLMYKIASGEAGAEKYNEFVQKNSTDKELKAEAAKAFATVQKVMPGQASPTFNYPDINGKQVALESLKGKMVYLDIWATWCAPCLAEVPHLKKLENDFHGKGIEFVSISIDPKEDFNKWQNMVKEKNLQGIQLFADNDWKSQFVKDYGIIGIPRFILLDAEGKIILSDAPRPSDPQIRTLIEENLKS